MSKETTFRFFFFSSSPTLTFFSFSFPLSESTMATAMMAADAGDLPDWLDAEDVLGDDDEGASLWREKRKKKAAQSINRHHQNGHRCSPLLSFFSPPPLSLSQSFKQLFLPLPILKRWGRGEMRRPRCGRPLKRATTTAVTSSISSNERSRLLLRRQTPPPPLPPPPPPLPALRRTPRSPTCSPRPCRAT